MGSMEGQGRATFELNSMFSDPPDASDQTTAEVSTVTQQWSRTSGIAPATKPRSVIDRSLKIKSQSDNSALAGYTSIMCAALSAALSAAYHSFTSVYRSRLFIAHLPALVSISRSR
jgi:hypothetical protein